MHENSDLNLQETIQKEVDRRLSRSLSLISHELRAPLHTIYGYLDLALDQAPEAPLHDFLVRARAGSEHLFCSIEDVLVVTRAEAGQLQLRPVPVRLADLLENVVAELELMAQDKAIAVAVTIADNVPMFLADRERLQQIVRNLLSNALRFTPDEGRVEIAAWIENVQGEEQIRLSVSDNGPGIAPEFQERIFERFFRVSTSGGQGLGLAVVKQLVEMHAGSIRVSSVQEEGSTFLCEIPLTRC
jgi:signal transduction histidine kinase